MKQLKEITTSLAPKEEGIIHDAASISVQSSQFGNATKSITQEETIYDKVLFGKTQLRHQQELEEMKNLTPDEHEVLEALLLLQQPFSFEETTSNEDEEEEEEEAVYEKQQKRKKIGKSKEEKTNKKQRTKEEKDDSEQTLRYMLNYKNKTPEYPPKKIFIHDPDALGDCSKPIRKQLTKSDVAVNLCRLMLGEEQVKKMMLDVLGKTLELDTKGFNVSVYGPNGEIHDMMFKKWNFNSVLASPTWKEFVEKYKLNKNCNFLTIWMFTHKRTHQICFAIDSTHFPVYKKLSNRIMKAAAFKNSN